MKRRLLVLCAACLFGAPAEAHLNESAAVARSQAMGGALVSLADGPAALFVNPAGIVGSSSTRLYLDYAEPAGVGGKRRWRAAAAAGSGSSRGALGWYRQGSGSEAEDLVAAGAAHRLAEGAQGSFLSIGAVVSAGGASRCAQGSGERGRSWVMSGDAGILLKPLPVVALAYSIGNIGDVHPEAECAGAAWHREQRWGAAYFWNDRVVLSAAGVRREGRTTRHYGIGMRTAAPIDLMAGYSDGNVTGGARWTGSRLGGIVAFAAGGNEGVTWTIACEARLGPNGDGGAQ